MRIQFGRKEHFSAFNLEPLTASMPLDNFSCRIDEYNEYLVRDALRSQNDHIALTWLLRERTTNVITAYMSLIADTIKLSVTEKELHNLAYPFSYFSVVGRFQTIAGRTDLSVR